jgi:hypothetical protein
MVELTGKVAILNSEKNEVIEIRNLGINPISIKEGFALPLIENKPEEIYGYELIEPSLSEIEIINSEAIKNWQLNPIDLSILKQRKKDEVKLKGNSILTSGYIHDFGPPYGIQTLQLRDNTDRTNWLTSQAAYQAQVLFGNGDVLGATFRTDSDQLVTLTFSQGLGVLLQMAAWGATLFNISWQKQDEIEQLTTIEEIEMYDIESGWQ